MSGRLVQKFGSVVYGGTRFGGGGGGGGNGRREFRPQFHQFSEHGCSIA